MSVIVIGDVHGTKHWKKIIDDNKKANDLIVFLGDYVDSYTVSPKDCYYNLIDIFNYKKENSNVYILVGNHDYHYMKFDTDKYSGYNRTYAEEYYNLYKNNLDYMSICLIKTINNKKYIFSHAGVSYNFLNEHNITLEQLNDLWKNNPSVFGFNHKCLDVYGNSSIQSPLWIRPQALIYNSIIGYKQVVGHTNFDKPIIVYPDEHLEDDITIVCTEDENGFIIIN